MRRLLLRGGFHLGRTCTNSIVGREHWWTFGFAFCFVVWLSCLLRVFSDALICWQRNAWPRLYGASFLGGLDDLVVLNTIILGVRQWAANAVAGAFIAA